MSDASCEPSTQNAGSPVAACAEKDPCKKAWDDVNREVGKIDAMQDVKERNKAISASYARLYQKAPELKWAGAAAFASKQVGCGMSGISGGMVKDTLGKGNLAVYDELYPALRFYQQNKSVMSNDQIMECMEHKPGPPLHDSIKQGLRETMNGAPSKGALTMLKHEQQDTLQESIYEDNFFRFGLGANKMLGLKPMTLVFSADCTTSDPSRVVDFSNYEGHLANFDSRWPFARDCAQKFVSLSSSPQTSSTIDAELTRIANAYPVH